MRPILKTVSISTALLLACLAVPAQDTGSVKGKVRTQKGRGISDVVITARQDGKNVRSVRTDKKGRFRISTLKPGIYNIVFEKPGFSGGVLYDVEIRRKKTNNLGDRLMLTVDQGTLVIVEASVFNQNGFVVYGAKVIIEEVFGDGGAKKVGSGYSSRDGGIKFRFAEKPATYRITASLRGVTASKTVKVNEAAIYRTAVTLDLSEKQ